MLVATGQTAWVQIPTGALTSCGTMGKLLSLFFPLQNEADHMN